MRRYDVTAVRHRLPTTLAVSSSGPYPRLKKKDSLWSLDHQKNRRVVVGGCLFSWLGLEVATRDALSHLQPQPGAPWISGDRRLVNW